MVSQSITVIWEYLYQMKTRHGQGVHVIVVGVKHDNQMQYMNQRLLSWYIPFLTHQIGPLHSHHSRGLIVQHITIAFSLRLGDFFTVFNLVLLIWGMERACLPILLSTRNQQSTTGTAVASPLNLILSR